jgi:uncharacterized membrane protein YeaQ/YmgE (transglycosylase-associated protein family)
MVQIVALILNFLALTGAVILGGLLSNWFRYELSLEGILVAIPLYLAVAIVAILATTAYRQRSTLFLTTSIATAVAGAVLVFLVYDHVFGGFPRFYLNHMDQSPPAVIQTPQGPLKYWLELKNPFSREHAEYLVVGRGKEQHIPVRIFDKPVDYYAGAVEPGDWATIVLTREPDIVILTVGRSLLHPGRFKIDLANGTAVKIVDGG